MTEGSRAPLEVTEHHDGQGGYELRLVGDIDLSTLPVLTAAVERVVTVEPASVGFDLSAVRFMDSSGIGVLLEVAAAVPSIALVAPSLAVRRLVELSGLTSVLPMTTSRSSAVTS